MTLTAKSEAIEFAFCKAVEMGVGANIYEIVCSIDTLNVLTDEEKEDVNDEIAKRFDDILDYQEALRLIEIGEMAAEEVEQVYGQGDAYAWARGLRQAI